MRKTFYFFFLLFTVTLTPAFAKDYRCPPMMEFQEAPIPADTLKKLKPESWDIGMEKTTSGVPLSHRCIRIDLREEDPTKGTASWAPDDYSGSGDLTWSFDAPPRKYKLWVTCSYADSALVVFQELDSSVKKCTSKNYKKGKCEFSCE